MFLLHPGQSTINEGKLSFEQMVGNVYSTYELAREKAVDKMIEEEQDIFICRCTYKSGEEFILKTRRQMISGGDYLYVVKLPFDHMFKEERNAIREAGRFSQEKGRDITIQKHCFKENGYNKFSHFSLCLI